MNTHLTPEAMLRWQTNDATEAERAHVASCAACRAQAKPLEDALSWFGSAARQWGEEKAAAVQEWREATATAGREWQEAKAAAARHWRGMVAAWGVACMALLLIFFFGSMPRWRAHRAAMEARVQERQQEEKQQTLARDNALLEEVDQDVSQEVPEAMQPLSWNTAGSGTAATNSGRAARQ
ncbi:MAG TPA: hypothetical protein VGM02_15555 [Acidobacteriaceae bacterium]|jgi:hypothetical protein